MQKKQSIPMVPIPRLVVNGMPLIADQVDTKDKAFSFTFSNATVVAQSPVQPRRRFLVVAVC